MLVPVFLPVCLSVCVSVCLSVRPSVCLPVSLPLCLMYSGDVWCLTTCVCVQPCRHGGELTGAAQACLSVCPSVCLSDVLRRCLVSDHMCVCAALQARGQLTGAAQARWRHTMGPAGIKSSAFQRVPVPHHLLMQCTAHLSYSPPVHAMHCPLIIFTTCSCHALPTHHIHHLLMQCTAHSSYALSLLCKCNAIVLSRNTTWKS